MKAALHAVQINGTCILLEIETVLPQEPCGLANAQHAALAAPANIGQAATAGITALGRAQAVQPIRTRPAQAQAVARRVQVVPPEHLGPARAAAAALESAARSHLHLLRPPPRLHHQARRHLRQWRPADASTRAATRPTIFARMVARAPRPPIANMGPIAMIVAGASTRHRQHGRLLAHHRCRPHPLAHRLPTTARTLRTAKLSSTSAIARRHQSAHANGRFSPSAARTAHPSGNRVRAPAPAHQQSFAPRPVYLAASPFAMVHRR